MSEPNTFDYRQAFDRNIGWLTPEDQTALRGSSVAIAGVGGAGGYQAQNLARLGVGRFKIADPDTFELTNFNRQIGATLHSLGKSKIETTRDMILAINPEAEVDCYPEGIHAGNIDRFLSGADVVMDGVDFFALDAKLLLFRKSREKGLVTITSCPLGFGASLAVFSPKGMSFEDFLDLHDSMKAMEKSLAVAFGLSPSPLCLPYMNKKAFGLGGDRAASTAPGLMLVGALSSTAAVQCLTHKKVLFAPHLLQIDLFTQKVKKKYYPWGMKGPLIRIKKAIFTAFLKRKLKK